jgi:esterase/lipase superfamily enzyme
MELFPRFAGPAFVRARNHAILDVDAEIPQVNPVIVLRAMLSLSLAMALACCSSGPKPQWLMPTPQIYQDGGINPFAKLPAPKRSTVMPVYFATNRDHTNRYFGANERTELSYGIAHVGMGGEQTGWPQLLRASTDGLRPDPLPLRLVDSPQSLPAKATRDPADWLKHLDQSTRRTRSRDVVIYVHGAKVEFFHSCAFAAELAHFSGRDLTPVAFDWPTHPEVYSYLLRVDLAHGIHSAKRLADLVRLVAEDTNTRRIHLVSWSAGARVLSRAMVHLAAGDAENVRARYRIGSCVFAASDVPEKDFIERLPAIHGLSERVTVYQSDEDGALVWASRLMGGGKRLGLEMGAPTPEEIRMLHQHPRLQLIDCSWEKEKRGFDISGHRYWYQHPWVSSDLMLSLLTSASPTRRGLAPGPEKGIYYFGPDYGARIGPIARELAR